MNRRKAVVPLNEHIKKQAIQKYGGRYADTKAAKQNMGMGKDKEMERQTGTRERDRHAD